MNQKKQLIGAHISIAGGFYKAIDRAEKIGCTVLQCFTKSNRQWHSPPISQKDANLFKNAWQHSSIEMVIVHASYLINIGSPNKETNEKSLKALIKEIERCHTLGIKYLVLHPGAHLKSPKKECLDRIADNLNQAINATENCDVVIAIETMAGQGSNVGDSFEDIAFILKKITVKKRVGVTFDTCHVFAAGYDISTKSGYHKTFKKFETIIGLNKLKVIHLNDSKRMLSAHVDRHEQLGKGKIGIECFKLVMKDKKLFNIPKILETPDPEKYAQEIQLLRSIQKN